MRANRTVLAAILGAGLVLGSGCVTIQWTDEMTDGQVNRTFERARGKAEKRAEKAAGKKPHRAHVLVYDADEDSFLRFSVPMWMVRMAVRHAVEEGTEPEVGGVQLDWQEVLQKGAGTYVTADDDEAQVLVWLE